MPGLFRAYGQIRRGTAPWRTPFFIPIGDLEPPFIQGPSNVSVDTGGTAPDMRIALVALSLDQFPTIRLQFRIQPFPGRALSDITLRMVLLKDGQSPFLDDGPLETDVGFVVLEYRVGPGKVFPNEVRIDLSSGVAKDDPDSLSVQPPGGTPETFPTGRPLLTIDRVGIDVVGSPTGGPLDVAGGMVTGDMVHLNGVETNYDSIFNQGYGESARQIRGIRLDRLELGAPPGAMLPTEATWFNVVASDPAASTGGASPSLTMSVDLRTPTRGKAPLAAPTATTTSGGGLRPGSYTYTVAFVHKNGNETDLSPRTPPISISASGDRSVTLTNFPPKPVTPSPDPTSLEVTKMRIYRTDCDQSVDVTDPDRGIRGDDVLVAEVDPAVASVVDTGPSDLSVEPSVRSDFIGVRYFGPKPLDLDGALRMIDGDKDTTYQGVVRSAPERVKVLYRPGRKPRLRWFASGETPKLSIGMPSMALPYGTGLFASVEDVPTQFCLDWLILGSEHVALGLAGDVSVDAPVSADPAVSPARVSVRMGPNAPIASWPNGEPTVAVELLDQTTASPGALVSLSKLRRAAFSVGSAKWASRDGDSGRLKLNALFDEVVPFEDRRLRFRYRSGSGDEHTNIDGTGQFLPAVIVLDAHLPEVGDKVVNLGFRARFLRASFDVLSPPKPAGASGIRLNGLAFIDDTTDALAFRASENDVELATKWPIRAGGKVVVAANPMGPGAEPVTLWLDGVIPEQLKSTTGLPLTTSFGGQGVSGRLALTWPSQKPLAVRANPQVKLLTAGDAESHPGLRAVTARVQGVTEVQVPKNLIEAFGASPPPVSEVKPTLRSHASRANRSIRFEMHSVESRVATDPDTWSVSPARSWMRARTADLPDKVEPTVILDGKSIAGLVVDTSSRWGPGVIWAEPRFIRDTHVDELGVDKGVGLITAGFDGIPAKVEALLLDHVGALGTRVASSDLLPNVGPIASDWTPGGAIIRMDGPIDLSHLMLTIPVGDRLVCSGTGNSKTPARHGEWMSVLAPFAKVVPTTGGTKQATVWSTHEPVGTPLGDLAVCSPGAASTPTVKTALGWGIGDELQVSLALRMYALEVPTGVHSPRWWAMPTSVETWDDKSIVTGVWELQQELQMKDHRNTIAVYPDEAADNPFGDWKGGDGQWWLRQRGGLDVPLIPTVWWSVASGDVFMGNVGGGYHIIASNGIFSTLPAIWTWSYP